MTYRDRFLRLSEVAVAPCRLLLAEKRRKASPWAIINKPWYKL